MKQITYNQVQDLPKDHPLMVEFLRQVNEQLNVEVGNVLSDEQSQAYFDRYVAGDR